VTITRARRLKLVALHAAEKLGAFEVVGASKWRRDRLLILCYHGVSLADEHGCDDEHVSREHLLRRFEILRRERCNVIPLDEAVARLRAGDLPPRSVSITFDDGLYDFSVQAYPALREFGYHATIYVATYYCTRSRPVFDSALAYLLWKGSGFDVPTGGLLPGAASVRVPDSRPDRSTLRARLVHEARARGLTAAEKEEILEEICESIGLSWEDFVSSRMYQLMTPAELSRLDSRFVDVQLHTHRHRTPRDPALFLKEIDDNIAALASMGFSADRPRHFCYPVGDVDPVMFPWLRSRNVCSATTCEPQIASRSSNPLALPRLIDTMGVTETEFRSWLSGLSAWVPQRSRLMRTR
jgi:peptidoglycan/xylan/chitin deacetylase (PgdA/CDA1 family)